MGWAGRRQMRRSSPVENPAAAHANATQASSLGLHQMFVFVFELPARFGMRGIDNDAFHRAHDHALRLIVMADAFGAQRGIDDVELLAKRNRLVRADGFADVAVDAGIEDLEGHAGLVYMGRLELSGTAVMRG